MVGTPMKSVKGGARPSYPSFRRFQIDVGENFGRNSTVAPAESAQ